MPVSQKVSVMKKLKTELAHVRSRIESIAGDGERAFVHFPSLVKDVVILPKSCSKVDTQNSTGRKRKSAEVTEQKDADRSEATVTGPYRHDNYGMLDTQNGMGVKMYITMMKQCAILLKTLMNHKSGWVFNQPVDPIQLNIPDYFDIISKPMDLGTIKQKIGKKLYTSTHQFAEDVRLTFSNAMTYNPPQNVVHIMAKNLNNIFNERWKSLELKWRKECSAFSQQSVSKIDKKQNATSQKALQKAPSCCSVSLSQESVSKIEKKQNVTSQKDLQKAPSCSSVSLSSKYLTEVEKLKLQNDLAKYSRKNIPQRLLKFLQKACLLDQSEDRINVDINTLDEATLLELHQIVRFSGGARPTKSAGLMRNSQDLTKECHKGGDDAKVRSGCLDVRARATSSTHICSSHPCIRLDCPYSCNDVRQASCSDVDSERSSGIHSASHLIASAWDAEKRPGVQTDYHSLISAGRIDSRATAAVGDNIQHIFGSFAPATNTLESGLSPTRALRAAKLKSRFADTILKAQHKTLLNPVEKAELAKMRREKEKLEKKQLEEKARIEAQVKAAEAAMRMKVETELKMQRQREREAARLAVQKMEKTVDIDENAHFLEELEKLGQSVDLAEQQPFGLKNPLAQLGLFIKEDDDLDEEVDNWISAAAENDVEEGEIGSSKRH